MIWMIFWKPSNCRDTVWSNQLLFTLGNPLFTRFSLCKPQNIRQLSYYHEAPPSWGLKCWPSSAFYSCFRDVSKMITIPCHILENTLHHYWLKHELRKFSGSDSSRPLYWTLRYLVLLKNNLRYFRGVSASWARLQRSTPTQMRSQL